MSAQDYERDAQAWLRAAGVDASVRFMGSHYQIGFWDASVGWREVWVLARDLVARMDELRAA